MCTGAKLLTTGEVARLCGFSPSAVLQWIRSGKLPAYSSPGGQNRIDPQQLLEFLETHGMRIPPQLEAQGPLRVLIVEDDEAVRTLLARMLEESGLDCAIDTAENGVIGCMKIPMFRPHLVILDIVMPELDGEELCHVVRSSQEFATTRLLVVTGYPEDPRVQSALAAGADDWIAKPVDFDQFVAGVRTLLGVEAGATRCVQAGG